MNRATDIHSSEHFTPREMPAIRQERSAHYPVQLTDDKEAEVQSAPFGQNAAVSDTGDLVLLAGEVFLAERVEQGPPQGNPGFLWAKVWIVARSVREETHLKSLGSNRQLSQRPVSFAYRNQAFTARVQSITCQTKNGERIWELDLLSRREQPAYLSELAFNGVQEVSINGLSSHDIAQMRAQLLLLDQKPTDNDELPDQFLAWIVAGGSDQHTSTGIFPLLWGQHHGHQDFLHIARLCAVYYLIETGICEHIFELSLGPIEQGKLKVRFRAQRHRASAAQEPTTIAVEGLCPLEPTVSDSVTDTRIIS